MDGILAVWKPEGWTSHDVVAKVRRILRLKRIGHAGTLDPMVTGVLPLCLGRSTRVVEYVQERPKAYEAVLKLGIATDTEDMTGQIIEQRPVRALTQEEIAEVLERFQGTIQQVPPMFSAVKVDGKRLYELAREGKQVERKSREVTIHEIQLLSAKLDMDQPEIAFSVVCSKGTYIRTLCVDIGKALELPATMAKLVRTMSGGITAESCLTLEQIQELADAGELEGRLIPADQGISHIPAGTLPPWAAKKALLGQKLPLDAAEVTETLNQDGLARLYDGNGTFLGIYRSDVEAGLFVPVKVFLP
ncbi:tRNA pseudouridine(55) synthase TruB [Paenibacillus sp. CAU 1782]